MPMYNISSAKSLSIKQRQELAEIITQIHCDITQAPPHFVTTIFSQGVPVLRHLHLYILGNVRKGRSAETNAHLTHHLRERICTLFEWPLSKVHVSLIEIPASWVMEGGEILPEPGQEAYCQWLLAQNACLSE